MSDKDRILKKIYKKVDYIKENSKTINEQADKISYTRCRLEPIRLLRTFDI